MIDARLIIASVFKDLYLSELREIRLRQTEFSIYLVEQLFLFHSIRESLSFAQA